ncbi:class I SAM-dependent methyltransferase [Sphingomonas sp. JC676]|uniref:class I SAM-dependent methyltransferase n=1 Tax=Sphingomonas sp. JC676 TaxID=2768065 RepID=UPI0016580800|nr:class I SAM-dependent methyltransferase [Sphingomonas sp. JC676]MBC9030859.1 class I SAM-dependent methyltransferase [Sphingomonas sp. JC676]
MNVPLSDTLERFRTDYAAHRALEGRGHGHEELLSLPWLKYGPLARQWAVRARTFEAFVEHVVDPMERHLRRRPRTLDLGAGNGWLSYRLALRGHDCAAIDIRDDRVDGLGAAKAFLEEVSFDCFVASFDALPVGDRIADLTVFNAALHYATNLGTTLAEAVRATQRGGTIVILDSPFYAQDAQGAAMVAEKHAHAAERFGDRAGSLLALPHIEYLTAARLGRASASLGLVWRRRRVTYPFWYELRPLTARLRRARVPSRFDIWTAQIP